MSMEMVEAATVRDLVLDSVRSFAPQVRVTDADVAEGVVSDGPASLVIRLKVDAHPHDSGWPQVRLRLSQRIRDELIRVGDDRYPVLLMFASGEWDKRDK